MLAGGIAATRLLVTHDAATRLARAGEWIDGYPRDAELLVVGTTLDACDDLVRGATLRAGARFGTERLTLALLAARLAAPGLAAEGRAAASSLTLVAVTARAVHHLLQAGKLTYFRHIAGRPGFARALARTLEELRMNGVIPTRLARLEAVGRDLAALARRVERELGAAGLADRAAVFAAAVAALEKGVVAPAGRPLLLLDLAPVSVREQTLVRALVHHAPTVLATAPTGDEATTMRLAALLGCPPEPAPTGDGPRALAALQTHLFAESVPPPVAGDDSVTLRAWPGEARECVEIARAIQSAAASGTPFDRIAVLLRSPAEYRPYLEEAFGRANIPAHFVRGTTRPDPAGRAFLALLACAAERLSARRFAEYVSLGQVPDPDAPHDTAAAWSPPDHDLVTATDAPPPRVAAREPDPDAAVVEGTLRAPWRWEQLLVDAAVIGERDRWARRLAGLEAELRKSLAALADDEDETRRAAVGRRLRDLGHLGDCALPLIDRLAALPDRAAWGVWLAALRDLAVATLREPQRVLATLAELEPMGPVGPVALDEVRLVLGPRLRELAEPAARRRYGAVLVAPAEAARGLALDVVLVPGLAERLFPRKVVEDPILPDAARRTLDVPELATQPTRVGAERLALRLAVGAARTRVHLSYPRLDVEQGRARVPSFYGLEALRAVEGVLPGFETLRQRAEPEGRARLGWPAPPEPARAIDEAEYDLALLAPFLDVDDATAVGTAHYLLTANPHLGRALRARARRWLKRWTPADGLVQPNELGRTALARHQLSARAFSPTALQHFASCPYRFFLQAIHRLQPREEPVAIEVMDPLTRGALFHDVQFAVLTALREQDRLPVRPATLAAAQAVADDAVDRIADAYRDELCPAIPRVWEDGLAGVRADLREWLRRAADAEDGWVPERFELAFGLADRDRPYADPASVPDPVSLEGGLRLRGSIDLVERHASGGLRATDHKTGRVRAKSGVVVGGGEVLQPVLYALAIERLLGQPVEAGRLYYCTADGEYTERVVPLDARARESAATVAQVVGDALAAGFLPAAPTETACAWCDYRTVCGPHEYDRTQRKPPVERVADLGRLRGLP